MRIAMIGTKGIPAKWGGIEKYIEEIGTRLAARGHKVTVFGSKWFCKDYRGKIYRGIRISTLPVIPMKATAAINNALLATIAIALTHYDIVNFHGYASYFFLPAIRRMGNITIVTTHGFESGWMNPKYSSFESCMIRHAFNLGITHADSVTTVADHLGKKIKESFRIDAQVLPSGLDKASSCPAQLIKEKYRLNSIEYFLFLGRIDPIKRVDWILDILPILDKDTKVVIAGGAQDSTTRSYLQILKQRAAAHPQIIFTGPVYGQEKAELLSNCLALLAPSYNEGLPITLLEALSYGRCCIASDISAHCEIVESGSTGFLFPRDDKDAFIQLVRKIINEPKESIMSIGVKAKLQVESKFTWTRTVDQFEMLCNNLLQERRMIA